MFLTREKAFEILMSLFRENEELDSASVLVLWGDEIRDYDAKQQAATSRPLIRYYTLMHGTPQPQNPDDSRQFYLYAPDARYRVRVEDLEAFAREKGIAYRKLLDVVEGRVPEYEGYRSYLQQGSMSKEYTPPRDVSVEDFGTPYKPSTTPAYREVLEPTVVDYQKKEGK